MDDKRGEKWRGRTDPFARASFHNQDDPLPRKRLVSSFEKVYVASGDLGTELRARAALEPGELVFTETAYCFGRQNDDTDDAALPSIVQAALEALQKASKEEELSTEATLTTKPEEGTHVQQLELGVTWWQQ